MFLLHSHTSRTHALDTANVSKSQLNLLLFVRCVASVSTLCLSVFRLGRSTSKLREKYVTLHTYGVQIRWQVTRKTSSECVRRANIGTYVIMLYCAIAIGMFAEIGQLTISGCGKRCAKHTKAWTHTDSMQFEGVLSQKVKLYLNVTHVYHVPTNLRLHKLDVLIFA